MELYCVVTKFHNRVSGVLRLRMNEWKERENTLAEMNENLSEWTK